MKTVKAIMDSVYVIGVVVLAFFVFIALSMFAGEVYNSVAPSEQSSLFRELDKKGYIEWTLNKDNKKEWKLKCPCDH